MLRETNRPLTWSEQLHRMMELALQDEYKYNMSNCQYDKKHHVTLSKDTVEGASVTVRGSGETPLQAWDDCFKNFPKVPISGEKWKTDRLTYSPKAEEAEDAEFEAVTPIHETKRW